MPGRVQMATLIWLHAKRVVFEQKRYTFLFVRFDLGQSDIKQISNNQTNNQTRL